jgi:microsomal dipeptidase-like Zn-dependent dipeptidase
MNHSVIKKDNKRKIKKHPFYAWSLNVSGEEAIAIHDSGGIAGIILDKGRHSGIKQLKSIDKIQDADEKKQHYLKLILDNIFFIVESINQKSAWDVPTLGTDFDGVITHFEHYPDMSALPQLKKDLINYLKKIITKKNCGLDITLKN